MGKKFIPSGTTNEPNQTRMRFPDKTRKLYIKLLVKKERIRNKPKN